MEKVVSIELDRMTVTVSGKNQAEWLENAKKEVIKQLETNFPHFTYSIHDANVMTLEEAFPGTIVEDTNGNVGIITSVNPKNQRPVNVTMTNGVSYSGIPEAFKLSKKTFEEARQRRNHPTVDEWYEGESGYLHANGAIYEVVVGKCTRGKYLVHKINNKGEGFKLNESQIKTLLKDNK